jgi:16S rRNA (guanine527-N7)-methyltransferase
MDNILEKYSLLNEIKVSRETCVDFERFILLVLNENKKINIISKKTEKDIRVRHIIDSAQAFDFIDLNDKVVTDLGSGAGFPGIVLALMLKRINKRIQFNLFEKSYHKSQFLKKISNKFKLNAVTYKKNIFETKNISTDTIIARAFKSLPDILDLIDKNFKNYKNLVLFMGNEGNKKINDALKKWNFVYEKKNSITSKDSFIINIKNIRKKN